MALDTQSFFLYGEPPRPAEASFLHLEPLDVRTRPGGWSIRPHRHADLNHVFLMTGGGGAILQEDEDLAFEAPCLLFIPAGLAHGFAFQRESTGHVLTLASSFLAGRTACAEASSRLFARSLALGCGPEAAALQAAFADLYRELGWQAPGHDLAVESLVYRTFAVALRLEHQARATGGSQIGRDQALLARFRERVELSFRAPPPLQTFARELGVSLSRLHQACRGAAGATPLGLVQERVLLEAKRALLYSDMAVADVAADLGFSDPAYFSRFFTRHAGLSPSRFRQARPSRAHRPGEGAPPARRLDDCAG